jgi:Tfp pilus assembly PilM family ATPase
MLAALRNHTLSDTRTYAIVDIGKTAASLVVIANQTLAFARTLSETSDKEAFEQWLAQLAIEIQNSIENYQIQFGGLKIDELFLTGGFSRKEGLLAYLESTLKIKISDLKSFRNINTSSFRRINFDELEQYYAAAMGLAL